MSEERKGEASKRAKRNESGVVIETDVTEIDYAAECHNMRQVLNIDLAALRQHAGVGEAALLRRSYDPLQTANGVKPVELDSSGSGCVHAIVGSSTAEGEHFIEYKYVAANGELSVAKRSSDGEVVVVEEPVKDDLRGFQHIRNLAGIIFDCDTQEKRQY